jgi:hypothetical protein
MHESPLSDEAIKEEPKRFKVVSGITCPDVTEDSRGCIDTWKFLLKG